jgi:signal transduction histidine kinase
MRLDMARAPQQLNADENFALFRLIQELVTNAIRHAKATEIWISGQPRAEGYSLEVGDNGKGFDAKAEPSASKGIGAQNIQARISFLSARLETDSQPGKGSRFIIHLPKP